MLVVPVGDVAATINQWVADGFPWPEWEWTGTEDPYTNAPEAVVYAWREEPDEPMPPVVGLVRPRVTIVRRRR